MSASLSTFSFIAHLSPFDQRIRTRRAREQNTERSAPHPLPSRSPVVRSYSSTLCPACFASSHRLNERWLSPDGRPRDQSLDAEVLGPDRASEYPDRRRLAPSYHAPHGWRA